MHILERYQMLLTRLQYYTYRLTILPLMLESG